MHDAAITQVDAEALLRQEISRCVAQALRWCPILAHDAGRLGAIADFVYNLGAGRLQTSTLRRRINQQDWPEAKKELMRWVRGGGRILPGLVRRRAAEAALLR